MSNISILLPTYKEAPYLARAITSVINQSYKDWELLIIDDGLTELSKRTVLDFVKNDKRIVLISNSKNLGIQKSLNKGLSIANGAYIARIDDDDEWVDKNKLSEQLNFLKNNSGYVLVGTGVIVVNENEKELFRYFCPQNDKEIRARMLYKNCFVHSSVMFDKQIALKVGGYSESQEVLHVEDYELWLKLGLEGKMHNLPINGIFFTVHANSISAKNKRDQLFRNIKLINKFKNSYPNYRINFIQANFKAYMYDMFCKLPNFFKKQIFKFYKKVL